MIKSAFVAFSCMIWWWLMFVSEYRRLDYSLLAPDINNVRSENPIISTCRYSGERQSAYYCLTCQVIDTTSKNLSHEPCVCRHTVWFIRQNRILQLVIVFQPPSWHCHFFIPFQCYFCMRTSVSWHSKNLKRINPFYWYQLLFSADS